MMQIGTPRVIVVGTGFGCRVQIPALRAAGFEVVGLVGSDSGRTAERAVLSGVQESFTDLDVAVSRTGAIAVAVATPPNTHFEFAATAIARGCHIICEKPFAMSSAEAGKLLDAAEAAAVIHFLGNEFRFLPQRALVARCIREGLIGEPRLVTCVDYSDYALEYRDSLPGWLSEPDAGGGWLGCSGSHLLDQIRTEVGEFASINATLSILTNALGEAEDSFTVRFSLHNGAEGILQQTCGSFGPHEAIYRVAGTAGTIWTKGSEVWFGNHEGSHQLPIPDELKLPPATVAQSDDPRRSTQEWQILTEIEIAPYTMLCKAFRSAIEHTPSPSGVRPATFADGLAAISVAEAIRRSANSNSSTEVIDNIS